MRKQNKNQINKTKIFLGPVLAVLLLSMLTVVAFAEDGSDTASAGAQAIAIGDETETVVQATVNNDGASSSATSRAKAENGGTATAIAEAWANWIDGSSAYASAMAVAVAGIGETIWAEATAQASVSSDGTTNAYAGACVGDAGCINQDSEEGNGGDGNNGNNGNIIVKVVSEPESTGGFSFGSNDIERYCTYKLQLVDNDTENDAHAAYFMNVIAWGDHGFTNDVFENKFKITDTSCTELLKDKKVYQFKP